jgi:protein PhnA
LICPDCGHEWSPEAARTDDEDTGTVIKDSNGQVLTDGDAVILIKDLKLKGSSITLKKGTKVKSIRLVGGDHDVDCKIDGMSVMLKSEFLKKA